MRSMTGYGRASSQELEGLQWVVEISGLNRKMLDIAVNLPKEMLHFEIEVRERLTQVVERGQITVRINLKQSPMKWQHMPAFLSSLQTLKSTWVELAKNLGYSEDVVSLPFLLNLLNEQPIEQLPIDQEKAHATLLDTLDVAINDFLQMKRREGERLSLDLYERFEAIRQCVQEIEKESAQSPNKFYLKLKERIHELAGPSFAEDERVLREVALYSEKADTTEEITRLYSHLKQAFALFKEGDKSVGRSLDFLIQEMQREVSTISAKSASLEITNRTLFAKAELEKIREQVQNIE